MANNHRNNLGSSVFIKPDSATAQRMRRVATQNTPIERRVRSVLHRLGFRFRLNNKGILGKPDIILPRYQTAVFVHGCFWHGHAHCRKGLLRPKRNSEYWERKLARNIDRDIQVTKQLEGIGWKVLTIWECQALDELQLRGIIINFFNRTFTSEEPSQVAASNR